MELIFYNNIKSLTIKRYNKEIKPKKTHQPTSEKRSVTKMNIDRQTGYKLTT